MMAPSVDQVQPLTDAVLAGQRTAVGKALSLVEGDSAPETVSATSTGTSADVTVSADTETTCAVAAVDSLGNVGLLSNLSCATPGPVTDFFEYYNSSGGKAGNGCACGLVGYRRGGLGSLAALLLLGVALSVRRRRAGGAA